MTKTILRIAVPTPLYRSFDYLPPADDANSLLQPGQRLRINFGRRNTVGVLLALTAESGIPVNKLKPAIERLDTEPVISADILAMVQWASAYYHYPIGEALAAALPTLLRRGESPDAAPVSAWRLTAAGRDVAPATLSRAARQAAVMALLYQHPEGLERPAIDAPSSVLHALRDKGWIESFVRRSETSPDPAAAEHEAEAPHILNPAQQRAVTAILAALDRFQPWLLEGVTASVKGEGYLQLCAGELGGLLRVCWLGADFGGTRALGRRWRGRVRGPRA